MIKMPVEAPVTQWLFHKASMAGVPLSGTFEVSPLCNMDCKMCYVRLSRQQQEAIRPLATVEQWLALAQRNLSEEEGKYLEAFYITAEYGGIRAIPEEKYRLLRDDCCECERTEDKK